MRIVVPFFALALSATSLAQEIRITELVAVGNVARGGRIPIPQDPVLQRLINREFVTPTANATIKSWDAKERKWEVLKAKEDGWFEGNQLVGGYAYAEVDSPREEIRWLDAAGHTLVYVNGVPRAGDPYGYGYLRLPVKLKAGKNQFLFSVGRGRLKASLTTPTKPHTLHLGDLTTPDDLEGSIKRLVGGVVVVNASDQPLKGARVGATSGGKTTWTDVPTVPALGIRKVPFWFTPADTREKEYKVGLVLEPGGRRARQPVTAALLGTGALLDREITIRRLSPKQHHKRTFISAIDGSVQYYAVAPSQKPGKDNALVFSVHGASVEATSQANAYKVKDWATVVAPTNRRPFGFDWEDWGRLDALEVMELGKKTFAHDPRRVHLTGHSMGGHGTWHIGLTFADRFGVIAPSAGWSSFFSYGGSPRIEPENEHQAAFQRAMNPSDTNELLRNSLNQKIFILHGDKDDNVPVTEARAMRELLQKNQHPAVLYHEQPGAGHWFGDESVDWPGIFDLMKSTYKPSTVDEIDFTTANPAISSRYFWAEVLQQEEPLAFSRVKLSRKLGQIVGTTANVAALRLDLSKMSSIREIRLDDSVIEVARPRVFVLEKSGRRWVEGTVGKGEKGPQRGSGFKNVFNHRPILVYGTHGTPEENAWMADKARFDAETFYYRGNGAFDIMSDTEILRTSHRGRNIILYGNRVSNSAYKLLGEKNMQSIRAFLDTFGPPERGLGRTDLMFLYCGPKPGSDVNMVGVVGVRGLAGMQMATRLPYFGSGIAYPDYALIEAREPTGLDSVLGAGYMDNQWQVRR